MKIEDLRFELHIRGDRGIIVVEEMLREESYDDAIVLMFQSAFITGPESSVGACYRLVAWSNNHRAMAIRDFQRTVEHCSEILEQDVDLSFELSPDEQESLLTEMHAQIDDGFSIRARYEQLGDGTSARHFVTVDFDAVAFLTEHGDDDDFTPESLWHGRIIDRVACNGMVRSFIEQRSQDEAERYLKDIEHFRNSSQVPASV